MLVKIHKSYRNIIAICDFELLGKKFKENIFQLDIKENFFGGKKVSKNELFEIISNFFKEDSTFYIIGKKSIDYSIEFGLIKKEDIKKIDNVPFVLILS
jgi:uncharacterized protein